MKNNRKKRVLKWLIVALSVLLLIVCAFGFYVSDYYHADITAISEFSCSKTVTKKSLADGVIAYSSEEINAGLIFYPGGKVEYTAYEPLMKACAENGVLCVLVEMPFNLAVLDVNAANGIREQFPEVEDWYIGGHSLGGSMAASFVSKNVDDFDGLILLASYSTADLSETDLNVLSVYGSEDMVLNRENYDKYLGNLPDDFSETILDGGCHAYFGMYGEQSGDGTPTLENEEQIRLTADIIDEFIK